VAAITAEQLRALGLEVHHCPSAETALEAFGGHDFDLVATDVVLAGKLSGLSLVRRIRASGAVAAAAKADALRQRFMALKPRGIPVTAGFGVVQLPPGANWACWSRTSGSKPTG
jgi:CheY-like chemotaxis protein